MNEHQIKGKLLGVHGLSDIIGYIPHNYVVLLVGLPGTGKTSFALCTAYINAIKLHSKVLYISTNEDKEKLKVIAKNIGCDIDEVADKVKIREFPTLSDEDLINYISEEIAKGAFQDFDMIVVDSVTPILKILETFPRKRAWLREVLYKLSSLRKTTVFLIADILIAEDPDTLLLEYLADMVIKFNYKPRSIFPRSLEIIKFRGRESPSLPLYFLISHEGLRAVNVVSDKLAESIRKKRKEIAIEGACAKKIFGPKLIPGTQIGIVIKYPATSLGLLRSYLVYKFGLEALTKGIKVGIVYYGGLKKELKISDEEIVGKYVSDKITVVNVDLSKQIILPYLIKKWVGKPEEVDVLVISRYEKLAEIYGINELNKMIAVFQQVDKSLGIITLRVYRVVEPGFKIPTALLSMSDIILEITLNEKKEGFNIKVVRAPHIEKPLVILDKELEHDIKALKQKFHEQIKHL